MIYLCILYRNDGTDNFDGETNMGSEKLLVSAGDQEQAATVAIDYWHQDIEALSKDGYEPGVGTEFDSNTLLSFDPNREYKS